MLINIWNYIKCNLADWITLIVEAVGLFFVYITLRKDRQIKEAEFITEYNFEFISSQPLIDMERKLEACYQLSKVLPSPLSSEEAYREAWVSMVKIMGFSKPSATQGISRSYQKMINYLVYWEAFAPLILSGRVKLEAIDDAFGYRYFIAMNNPVVQKYELLEEAEYYCGCLRLYEQWYRYRKRHGKEIPLEEFALCRMGTEAAPGENPVYFMKATDEEPDGSGAKCLRTYRRIACSQCRSKCEKDKGRNKFHGGKRKKDCNEKSGLQT